MTASCNTSRSAVDSRNLRPSRPASSGVSTASEIVEIVRDHIPPAIGLTRRYQTLQAMINCTRRSLLPNPNFTAKEREEWQLSIRELERMGIN